MSAFDIAVRVLGLLAVAWSAYSLGRRRPAKVEPPQSLWMDGTDDVVAIGSKDPPWDATRRPWRRPARKKMGAALRAVHMARKEAS